MIWVRSQDKKKFAEFNCFAVCSRSVFGYQGADDEEGIPLGVYENEQRAIEVLNLIQNNCRNDYNTCNMPQQ